MEADWEIELGSDAPVIDACWAGFVDLRLAPDRVAGLEEVQKLPALARVLVSLNAAASPVWTAKCDVWAVKGPFDPDEFGTTPQDTAFAFACYIDLLPRSGLQWPTPDAVTGACKQLTARLRGIRLRDCRADLVVRRAYTAPAAATLGMTAYLSGCGASETTARSSLAAAVIALAAAVLSSGTPAPSHSPLQWKSTAP